MAVNPSGKGSLSWKCNYMKDQSATSPKGSLGLTKIMQSWWYVVSGPFFPSMSLKEGWGFSSQDAGVVFLPVDTQDANPAWASSSPCSPCCRTLFHWYLGDKVWLLPYIKRKEFTDKVTDFIVKILDFVHVPELALGPKRAKAPALHVIYLTPQLNLLPFLLTGPWAITWDP